MSGERGGRPGARTGWSFDAEPSWPEPGSSVSWFVGQRNSDLAEGRGPWVDVITHTSDPLVCFDAIRHASTQGEDGVVTEVTLTVADDGSVRRGTREVYGSDYDWSTRRRTWSWREEFAHLNDR